MDAVRFSTAVPPLRRVSEITPGRNLFRGDKGGAPDGRAVRRFRTGRYGE